MATVCSKIIRFSECTFHAHVQRCLVFIVKFTVAVHRLEWWFRLLIIWRFGKWIGARCEAIVIFCNATADRLHRIQVRFRMVWLVKIILRRLLLLMLLLLLLIATTGLWRVQRGGLMLWPLMEILQWLLGVAVRQWFHEMRVLSGAMHAWDNVTVVAEKVQSLMRIEQQFEATVTLNERKEEKSMRGTCVRICIFSFSFSPMSFTANPPPPSIQFTRWNSFRTTKKHKM